MRPGRTDGVAQSAHQRESKKSRKPSALLQTVAASGYYLHLQRLLLIFGVCVYSQRSFGELGFWKEKHLLFKKKKTTCEDMHRCTAVLLLLVVSLYFLSAEGKLQMLLFVLFRTKLVIFWKWDVLFFYWRYDDDVANLIINYTWFTFCLCVHDGTGWRNYVQKHPHPEYVWNVWVKLVTNIATFPKQCLKWCICLHVYVHRIMYCWHHQYDVLIWLLNAPLCS